MSCRGQAIVELCVGLLALLLVFVGLLQIGRLGRVHNETMLAAREEAAAYASGEVSGDSSDAEYILNWMIGRDGSRHSADDFPVRGNTAPFYSEIVAVADPDRMADYSADNSLTKLDETGTPMEEFDLLRGYSGKTVELYPLINNLVYRKKRIRVGSEVWLPRLGDLK